ncbi:MAG: PEP-CTERM sorting domain-containing protein [Planctomycetaceae bacterium]|nr:PEP-CTERM sorting domain-containing protein [Planctomycetaceae bacterium]
MKQITYWQSIAIVLFFSILQTASAESPYILLGPADQLALDQPRIAMEFEDPDTGQILGPAFANTFLLDTGANSILAVDDAIAELNRNGYRTEGTFFERGIGGFTEFDVSAEYNINFAGSDGIPNTITDARILSSTTESFCPVPGLCSFYGIAGMPLMNERVTTMDLSSLGGGDTGGGDIFGDIFDSLMGVDFLSTTFSDQLPTTNLRRYNIPVTPVAFDPESEGPIPVWVDLPFVSADAVQGTTRVNGNLVLDTGAQMSILSTDMAFDLGLDANGDGRLEDNAVGSQAIGGVGGQINAPLMLVDELRVPTEQGVELVFTDLNVAIVDIDPTIDGIFGMNFLASGWTGSLLGGDLGDLSDLLDDANLGDLLDGLGGLGVGADGSPYGFFQRVHFDFRDFENGNGSIVVDLTEDVTEVIGSDGLHGDLDNDGDIDFDDRKIWVHDVQQTYFGDSTLDGEFDTRDLVAVFQAGEYEDDLLENSSWGTGDWNGDGDFTSGDLVTAFSDGGFERGPRTNANTVPEPSSGLLLLIALGGLWGRNRRRSC